MEELAKALAGEPAPQSDLAQTLTGNPWTAEAEAKLLADEYWRGLKSLVPKTWGEAGKMAAYATPGLGNALSARDAYKAANAGDWPAFALGALGTLPLGNEITTLVKPVAGGLRASVMRGGKELGFVSGSLKDGSLIVDKSTLPVQEHGNGYGLAMYKALIDNALSQGLPVHSAWELSEKASHVYDALARRGYNVERLPYTIEPQSGGRRTVVTGDYTKRPVTVTAGPQSE